MPKKKAKPFINKKDAEHFSVVHRSQLDPKFYDDEASKYVLMSSKARLAFPSGTSVVDGDGASVSAGAPRASTRRRGAGIAEAGYDGGSVAGSVARSVVRELRVVGAGAARGIREFSEVDELGFEGTGYDYSRHLRAMGGGTYVSASGASVAASSVHQTHGAAARFDIPEDVLPSRPDEELERMLEAINLNPATLPRDIREALAALEEEDEEEGDDDEGATAAPGGVSAPSSAAADAPAVAAATIAPPERAHVRISAVGLEELDDEFVMQAAGEWIPLWTHRSRLVVCVSLSAVELLWVRPTPAPAYFQERSPCQSG